MTMKESSARSDGIGLLNLYCQNPSIPLRNQLVELHKGLVRKVAYKFSQGCSEPYEDLEQIGYFGLIRAIERFNPDHGYAFSSFAVPYIRGEILHFLRDRSSLLKIPRRWQDLYNQGQKIRKELTINLGRLPKDIEIANALNISLAEWQETKLAAKNRIPLSIDAFTSNYIESPTTWAELLPCTHTIVLQQQQEEQQQIEIAMNMLDDKCRMAVELVFVKELTRKDAAHKIGASPMKVTRYLKKGLQDLMYYLSPSSVVTG